MSEPSTNKYEIKVYGLNGQLMEIITNFYSKIEMSGTEMKDFSYMLKKAYDLDQKNIETFKNSINSLHFDKYNRLWVCSSQNRNTNDKMYIVDIFKNGVYQNQITIPELTGRDYFYIDQQLHFIGEYIYVLDKENAEIIVYDY